MKKQIYFIEANIGAGKTTLIYNLKQAGYTVFEEPVNIWRTKYIDDQGKNMLQIFYEDMVNKSFQFEVMAMYTRWNNIKQAIDHESNLIFIERSLLTDRNSFAKNLKEHNLMSNIDWQIYNDWYDNYLEIVDYHLKNIDIKYIYLRTEPEVCHERMLKRDRKEESTVSLDYLRQLHEKKEDWLGENGQQQSFVIDGHKTQDEIRADVIDIITSNKPIEKSISKKYIDMFILFIIIFIFFAIYTDIV